MRGIKINVSGRDKEEYPDFPLIILRGNISLYFAKYWASWVKAVEELKGDGAWSAGSTTELVLCCGGPDETPDSAAGTPHHGSWCSQSRCEPLSEQTPEPQSVAGCDNNCNHFRAGTGNVFRV